MSYSPHTYLIQEDKKTITEVNTAWYGNVWWNSYVLNNLKRAKLKDDEYVMIYGDHDRFIYDYKSFRAKARRMIKSNHENAIPARAMLRLISREIKEQKIKEPKYIIISEW